MCDQLTYDNVFVYYQPGTYSELCVWDTESLILY
jgi:hypothetical protein